MFPNDPKRRLEVWWSNPADRTGTYLIDIKGKSTWGAPARHAAWTQFAQLEKLNHKPFKIKGFDKNGVATVSDWDGGALASLPGGCKSGVSLTADPKASPDAVGAMPARQRIQLVGSRLARGQTDRQRNPDRLLKTLGLPSSRGATCHLPRLRLRLRVARRTGIAAGAAAGFCCSLLIVRTSRAISRQVSNSV